MPNAFNFMASPFDCLDAAEQQVVRDNVDIAYFRADDLLLGCVEAVERRCHEIERVGH